MPRLRKMSCCPVVFTRVSAVFALLLLACEPELPQQPDAGPPRCGNRRVEAGETCDPPSSCPVSCNDGTACTTDTLTGSADTCNVTCAHSVITLCRRGDQCCPAGCNNLNDRECSAVCGNGVHEPGETCDPSSKNGPCPTSCDDGNACTRDVLTGSASNCSAACAHMPINACVHGDGCCPAGCSVVDDDDCPLACGDGIVTPPETCDPPSTCFTHCNDGNGCTVDRMTGSAANCNVACSWQPITQCQTGDSCCAPGCNVDNDWDCAPGCGNGTVEDGETCDPKDTCPGPIPCNDGNACTIDVITGSADDCSAVCTPHPITQCRNNDGCCAPGCTPANDDDCPINGAVPAR
jgi:hypothetical protein